MNRRDFLLGASSAAVVVTGRVGAVEEEAAPSHRIPSAHPRAPVTPTNTGSSTPVSPAPGLPVLTLHASQTGTLPYLATAYPLEGAVPAGQVVASPDDPTLTGSVLSTWPDGSAQVMVLAGSTPTTAGTTKTIRLGAAAASGVPLTTAAIARVFTTGITVNFGAGDRTLNVWTSPDWVWWANPQTICARYRLACGLGVMEAVIDVHAFADNHAWVEIVIENSKVDANASFVAGPTTQTYTNATVSVNGTSIAAVSSPTAGMRLPNARRRGTFAGGHEPLRAWYCSTWVLGDPGIEVTHDIASLQGHPWFFKPAESSSQVMLSKYTQPYDRYVPWATCRLRMPGMSAGGDDEQIAMFTEEQSDYLITGDVHARRAVLATGLACHTANFNWRHTNGRVPTRTQMTRKTAAAGSGNGRWPDIKTAPAWGSELGTVDGSHVPFVGLVPFLCRPSPCFIEIAQKEFCWHATNYGSGDAATHTFDQIRSRAWRSRNYAGAIFLTPDADYDGTGRKASLRAALASTIQVIRGFLDPPWNTLRLIYGLEKTGLRPRASSFMNLFCVMAWTTIDRVKVLRGLDQSAWTTMCERFCDFPVRYVNQATAGEWRALLYSQFLGEIVGRSIDMGFGDFGERNRIKYGPDVPEPSGPWLMDPNDGTVTNWATMKQVTYVPRWPNSYNYDAIFWAALCAAVERGGGEADKAWSRVVSGITNLNAWKTGFRTYPRFNRWPRNK